MQYPGTNEQFRQIFDASPDPIVITRVSNGRIVLVNEEFLRLSGHRVGDAIGRTGIELGLWPDPRMNEYCAALLQSNGTIRNLGMTFRGKLGEQRTFLLSAAEIHFGGEPCRLAIGRDITELRKIHGELVAAREAAEAASRAKSEFLSSMSHEIRTPLNAILGMAELLAESNADPEQQKYLSLMRSNGSALLSLINDILDLARVETGRMRLERSEFDLRALAAGVIDTLRLRADERGLTLDLIVASELPALMVGDQLRLRQVLMNLIGNAIKFTERGRITVAIEAEADASASASTAPSDPCDETLTLHFAVSDTGIGIPEEKLGDIFASFTQADSSTARRYGGSGLGLTIVKRLVELMHGRIWVESRVGAGSTFHFTVRVEAARPVPARPGAPSVNGRAAAPKVTEPAAAPEPRILAADDSPDNRFLLRAFLKRFACALEEAENGQAACDKFSAANYDVVLMDLQMPVMDGYAAMRAMRAEETRRGRSRTPIIALSAAALSEDAARARAAGCDLHVTKPISRFALIEALETALGRPLTPRAGAPAPPANGALESSA